MNAVALARRLAGLALTIDQGRPMASHWVAALALAAQADPVPGHTDTAMAQNSLPDEVKTFVVQQLACFETPSEVAKAVKDEFDIEIPRQSVEAYDPGKRAGRALSEEYRALFAATRTAFLADTAAIGISHKVVRLRTLARLIETAEKRGNMVLVASLLEQVARAFSVCAESMVWGSRRGDVLIH